MSESIKRERAKKMDSIYRGEIVEETPKRSKKPPEETVEESMKKLKDLDGLF